MNNPFIYSDDNKRYLTLAYHNKKLFGGRVYKASLSMGCLCPNVDGMVGTGGCTFCEGPSPASCSVEAQLQQELRRIHIKNPNALAIAYFQTGSNTYCSLDFLREQCEIVLKSPYIVGISIGTRADCIDEATADYLMALSHRTYLTVELGLQSIHDITAKRINRCHSFKQFVDTYSMLYSRGIRVCVHLMNSLPGETEEMMIETAKAVGQLRPGGVKIHMLNVLTNTAMAREYEKTPFHIQSREEYVDTVVKQLEYLPPNTVIERLTGDGIKSRIIEPAWAKDKLNTLVAIDKLQASLDTYQGKALQ